jgi:hypothetical protein
LRSLRGGSYSRGGSRSSGAYYHSSSSTRSSSSSSSARTSGSRNRSQNSNNTSNNYNTNRRGAPRSRMGHVLGGLLFAGVGLALLAILFPAAIGGCCLPLFAGLCCGIAASQLQTKPRLHHLQSPMNDNNKSDDHYHPEYCSQNRGGNGSGDYYATQESCAPITSTTNTMGKSQFQYPESWSPSSDMDFEHCARRAQDEVEGSSISIDANPKSPSCTPFSGSYATSYIDRATGVQHDATLQIYFSPDFYGRGYKLSGQGHDIDGPTVIEEGHVNHNGTAWWKERTISGDVGLKVVSRGTFDFSHGTFQGTWLANSGDQGAYIHFRALVAGGERHSSALNHHHNHQPTVVVGTGVTFTSSLSAHHSPQAIAPLRDGIPVVTASQVTSSPIHATNGGSHIIPIVSGTPVTRPTD